MKIFKTNSIKKYKPLSILSLDDNNQISLCNYKNKFLSGDDLKNNSIPTVDMIFLHLKKKIICFIEFKNSPYRNLNSWKYKKQFREKFFGSRIVLSENLILDIRDFKKVYIVVYKRDKNKSSVDEFEEWGNENKIIEFGLSDLIEKNFIDDIFTEDCEFLKVFFQYKFNIIFK